MLSGYSLTADSRRDQPSMQPLLDIPLCVPDVRRSKVMSDDASISQQDKLVRPSPKSQTTR